MSSGHPGGAFITELQLQPNDVLMGRGAPISDNAGNIRFLALVRERCEDYKQASTRKEKDAIARQIVNTIHGRSGIFLRRIDSPEEAAALGVPHDVPAAWTAVDEKTVLLKIKQALRDRGKDHHQDQQEEVARTASQVHDRDDADLFGMEAMVVHGLFSQESTPSAPLTKRARIDIAQQQHSTGHTNLHILLGNILPASVTGQVINRSQEAPDNSMQQLQQFPLQSSFSQPQQRQQQGQFHPPGTVFSQPSVEAQTPQLPYQGQGSTNIMHRASFDGCSPAPFTNFQFEDASLTTTTTARTTMNPAAFHHGATGPSQTQFSPPIPHRPHAGLDWNTSNATAGLHVQLDTTNSNLQRLEGERVKVDFRAAAFPQESKGGEQKDDQKLAAKSNNNSNSDTSGEAALRIACEVCDMGPMPSGGGVSLDPIELCLLSVLISLGLPTWSSTQFQTNGDICTSNTTTTTTAPYPFTWTHVGNHLVQEVQMFLYRKKLMLFNNNTANQQQRSAIAGFVSRLVTLSSAYSKNPASLARMTVMLLEKLRLQGGSSQFASNAAPSKSSGLAGRAWFEAMCGGTYHADSSHGTHHSFAAFLSKELGQWATSLNVVDDVGFPVPCSSMDFVASFPQFRQTDIFTTAAVLDASGCRTVLTQLSLLTRLRLIFQSNSSDDIVSILRTTLPAPQWGTSIAETALIDMSLLQGLLVNGFSGLMDLATSSDGEDVPLGILLRHMSITKIDVEKRAVQLACVLHQHVHSSRIKQIENDHTARIGEMMGL